MSIKSHTMLRNVLLTDAAATSAMGVLCFVAAGPLGSFLAISPNALRWVGLALVPFAGALFWSGLRTPISEGVVRLLAAGNVGWVILSVLVAATGMLGANALGVAFILVQAAAVAGFTYFEYAGLKGTTTMAAPGRAGVR
jgi:hypothetical protein